MSIEDLIAQKMGGGQPPQPEGMPQGGPPPQGAMPPPQPETDPAPTQEEEAIAKGAPNTEDKKALEDPVLYEVDIDGQKEHMTPSQIAGMKKRYSKLNHENAEAKELMDLWRGLKEKTGDGSKATKVLLQSLMKNAKMGQKPDGQSHSEEREAERKSQGNPDESLSGSLDEELERWSEENSVAIPPRFKEMLKSNEMLTKQNQMLMQMMKGIQEQGKGVAQKAAQAEQGSQEQKSNAMMQRVEMNLEKAAREHDVSEEQAQDFMVFAQQRGYDSSDLLDPQVANKLMGDFKNMGGTDELSALKRVLEQKKAYSGSMGGTPQSGGDPAANKPAPHEKLLARRGL